MDAREYKRVRTEAGLSQRELAARLAVARNTVARRETGSRPISREAELALLRAAASQDPGAEPGGRGTAAKTTHKE